MNAVEIEEAISRLAEQPFDAAEFPYAFLEAFGNKAVEKIRDGTIVSYIYDAEAGKIGKRR